MKIIFATNNQHKVDEIRSVLPKQIEIITLKEAGIDQDIPEPHDTIEANAVEKARVIHRLTEQNCFSEDTGLEVVALNGEPGVKSARYAGEDRSPNANIKKLLHCLKDKENRSARFKTVICLILDRKEYLFTGICNGRITEDVNGSEGFGYDPVFIPDGSDRTFAQMTMEEKNKFSHRRKATDELVSFLNNLTLNEQY
ncbi:MAG: non-canonical purine NTP pyrophosphatase, RdgB/HAM1 family [Chitinophagaceae bacterium]